MKKQSWLLLVLILLLAFSLRIFRLDVPDISGDEAWSWTVSGWSLPEIVSSDAETNPPLYHLLLFVQRRLGGDSEFALRLPSVWLGLLALAFMGRLGRAVGGRRLEITALVMAALSPFLVYYAQDARMYGPALAGASGSLTAFVLLWQRQAHGRPQPRSLWLWYGAASLTAVFSHYYAFAVLLAQAAAIFLVYKLDWSRLKPWLTAWAAMAVVFLPWPFIHLNFLDRKASSRFEEWTAAKFIEIARRTLAAYGAGTTLPPGESWHGWLVVGLALIGIVILWRRKKRRETAVFVAVIVGGIFFAWLVNPIMPFFWERYLLVGMPAFILLAAAGVEWLGRRGTNSGVAAAALLGFVALSSFQYQLFDDAFLKGGYGRVMADIANRSQPGDLILLNNPLQMPLFNYYQPTGLPFQLVDRGLINDEAVLNLHLDTLTAGARRIWLVEQGNPAEYDPAHQVQAWLGEHGSRGYFANHPAGGELSLFVMNAAAGEMQPLAAQLNGEINLTGFRLSPPVVLPGDSLLLTLTWEADTPAVRPYTVFTHLIGPDGRLAAQTDGQPGGGARPTNTWRPGETIEDNYALLLPEDLPPGRYTLRIGMYTWPELERLPVHASGRRVVDNALELTDITISGG